MKQHDGFIKNSDVNVLLAGGGHKPLSEFLDASSLKTVNGQSLIGIGDISAGGETIVPSSGSTLTAEVGKYYRYDTAVNSLTVTLPSTSSFTSTQKIIIYFRAGTSNSLTLSSTDDIKYMDRYDIEGGSTYEVTIMWNGYSWIVTSIEIEGLPVGAKRIEYLEATGTQYINTLYKPNNLTRVYCTMQMLSENSYPRLFGVSSGNAYNVTPGYIVDYENGVTSGTLHYLWNDSSWQIISSVTGDYNIHTYDFNKNVLSRDGVVISTHSPSTFQIDYYLAIFSYFWGSTITSESGAFMKGRLYDFRIWDNDVIQRYFIPVRIGQVGYLYDKISKQLFANAGSGNFVLGPDK